MSKDFLQFKVLDRVFKQAEELDKTLYQRFAFSLGVPKEDSKKLLKDFEDAGMIKSKKVYPNQRYYERLY